MTTYSIGFYDVDNLPFGPITVGSVQGTITTDCTNCFTAAADITDWNLTISVQGQTDWLNTSNSYMRFSNADYLYAGPQGLFWNFSGPAFDPMWFQNTADNSILEFGVNPIIDWQIGTSIAGITPANNLIGFAITSVPEPATWALMMLGFVIVACLQTNKRARQ